MAPPLLPDACPFCTRIDQPDALQETGALYVMPDKFPLVRGHVLIISTTHLACYGAADPAVWAELDETVARVRRFVEAAFGGTAFVLENGIAGQSVAHAHVHVLPTPPGALPARLDAHGGVRIDGWTAVARHFAQQGAYRYIEQGGSHWLVSGHGPHIAALRAILESASGVRFDPATGWAKTTTVEDVLEVARRWRRWIADGESGRA